MSFQEGFLSHANFSGGYGQNIYYYWSSDTPATIRASSYFSSSKILKLGDIIHVTSVDNVASPSEIYDFFILIVSGTNPTTTVERLSAGAPVNNVRYEDLRFPAVSINPPGAASDPDWDNTNGGWLFDAGSTEVLYVIAQLPHAWKEGTILEPHVHWERSTDASGTVLWQLRYEWTSYLEARTALATINESSPIANVDVADTMMITSLPSIDGVGRQISDMLVMRIERVGGSDNYGADARFLEFDIHYQVDDSGSRQEFTK